MANMVSRRVTFVKVKKGQVKRRPKMDMTVARPEGGETATPQFVPVDRPAPEPRSMWKMALIPVLVLGLVAAAFTLAMNMGDNIRKSNVVDARADREDFDVRADRKRAELPAYEDRVSSANLEGRKDPTDKSFLATHYAGAASGTVGGSAAGNGGAPAAAKGKAAQGQEKPSASCLVSYGGGDSAAFAQNLGDCLSKQK